jgi:small subunit ribosomal protein S1
VVVTDYGAFVEVQQGVEGLIHVSEMSWSAHLRTAHDFFKVGDVVEAVVLTLDREERKMSLGTKQLMPDPWSNVAVKYAKGTKHTATVRNFTGFGIFVELEEGVDGLVHISDLSWSKKVKHPAEFTKIGDKLDVVVLDIDLENRRLSLGHKQIEENPWDVFETIFTVDSVHTGTIISKEDKGAIVSLPYGVEAFCPPRHLMKADKTTAKLDETLEFKVIEFNKDKRIVVSHSRVVDDTMNAQKEASASAEKTEEMETKKAVKKVKESVSKTTLGDVQALSDLQTDMAETEKKNSETSEGSENTPTA